MTSILNPFLSLDVDLRKIAGNYTFIQDKVGIQVATVLKANGYGVGAVPVAQALHEAGCRTFYVATLDEGIALRRVLPKDATLYIFNSFIESHLPFFFEHNLIPILTTLSQIKLYQQHKGQTFFLHFDTGMSRLSLPLDHLEEALKILPASHVSWVMSHLACADDIQNPKNKEQLEKFKNLLPYFPNAKASFSASKGVNLGPDYFFDQIRLGIYLYGMTPSEETALSKQLSMAIKMRAQILEVKALKTGETVGYNATYKAPSPRRVATLAVGYADGIPLSFSNKNHFWLEGHKVPILGRVSMDLTVVDLTDLPPSLGKVGEWVDLIHDPVSFYEMSKAAGSSPHEMLTRLGQRCNRLYRKP